MAVRIENLVEYSILVPEIVNARSGEQATFDAALCSMILEQFGGFTQVPGLHGGWKNSQGEPMLDAVTEYRMAGPEGQATLGKVRDLAETIGRDLGEQAVYVRCPGDRVEILHILG